MFVTIIISYLLCFGHICEQAFLGAYSMPCELTVFIGMAYARAYSDIKIERVDYLAHFTTKKHLVHFINIGLLCTMSVLGDALIVSNPHC